MSNKFVYDEDETYWQEVDRAQKRRKASRREMKEFTGEIDDEFYDLIEYEEEFETFEPIKKRR